MNSWTDRSTSCWPLTPMMALAWRTKPSSYLPRPRPPLSRPLPWLCYPTADPIPSTPLSSTPGPPVSLPSALPCSLVIKTYANDQGLIWGGKAVLPPHLQNLMVSPPGMSLSDYYYYDELFSCLCTCIQWTTEVPQAMGKMESLVCRERLELKMSTTYR